MGTLINIETSTYTNDIIQKYTENKVGQYSKFLNLTPTFVTYYAINQVQSTTDTGTGSVVSELGYSSPLRFNKIKGLPVYNLPILTPDIDFDDNGMDLNLDLSDITLLPNTVKPTVPDHMLVTITDDLKILFRVNSFRYNTVMSNDFIMINLDIKAIGPDADKDIEPLVVKTYYTVFENIGTEDNCFIEEESVETVNTLTDTINELTDAYQNLYWDEVAGGYLLPNLSDRKNVIYDVFLNRFINDTDLIPHQATTLTIAPYLDFIPHGYDLLYRQCFLYAIYKKSIKFLSDAMYYWLGVVTNPLSPLVMYHYNALSLRYSIVREDVVGKDLRYYYDHLLIRAIRNKDKGYPVWPPLQEEPTESDNDTPTGDVSEDETTDTEMDDESTDEDTSIDGSSLEYLSESESDSDNSRIQKNNPLLNPIDDFEESEVRWNDTSELTDQEKELIQSYTEDQKYIFGLIISYMNDVALEIDTNHIIKPVLTNGRFSYFYTPILIFILKKEYQRYFTNPTSLSGDSL